MVSAVLPARRGAPPFGGALTDGRALVWAVALALLLGTARKLGVGLDRLLSLDESWTGAIAAAPDVPTLIRFCLAEMSGPAFYGSAWAWAKLAGTGDLALRAPALAAAVGTPLLILWRGHPDRTVRLLWAGLTAVWLPGSIFASEARPYAPLLLIGTAQTIALAALIRAPTHRRAWGWAGLAALGGLTHYYTLPVSAVQGLLILTRGRAAWRCWPALLVFVPMLAWMAWHLPTLRMFTAPGGNWYPPTRLADLATMLPAAALGLPALAYALAAAIMVSLLRAPRVFMRTDVQVALTGAAALALIAMLALLRPSFSPRYVLPCMPPILFGLALWAAGVRRRWPYAPLLLLGAFLLLALAEAGARLAIPADRTHAESIEVASEAIATARPRRLVALFDGPGVAPPDRSLPRAVAGFFLARAGHPVEVLAPPLREGDPNRLLTRLANRPDDAILWVYDAGRPGTLGARHPNVIPRTDPRFTCRDYGTGPLAVIACWQPRR
ncbi:hypothetical protein [Sphingomonas jatrophae]|uniref:Dolichyl-phosphate-mannose-protein mannosyltransferase n=1 Tax=Sphingomonas jatrophae TaxID=1166337 RepID=A0A1I6JNE2_9SPHN|nr:hypothetical protein [Sphingomonas jatrophae]SFR80050.1 hypothetical protein SAMN05192580_0516 [Sphingomonas jatrophae]